MKYAEAKALREFLAASHADRADVLKEIPGVGSGPMGLTPDAVKATVEYKFAHLAVNMAFMHLRQFNSIFLNSFNKEIRAERRQRVAS